MTDPSSERFAFGGPVARTSASLRLFGDSLDPAAITKSLGAQPDHAVRKGEVWRTPKGTEVVAKTGRWMRSAGEASPGDLASQILKLLSQMTDDLETWRELTSRYETSLFCGLFLDRLNQGLSLNHDVTLMLGLRGIRLDLDIYGDDGRVDVVEGDA